MNRIYTENGIRTETYAQDIKGTGHADERSLTRSPIENCLVYIYRIIVLHYSIHNNSNGNY